MSDLTKRWRPGPFEGIPGDLDRAQLDVALKAIFDHSYGLEQQATLTPPSLNGLSVSTGSVVVKGSVKAVASGLKSLSNVIVSIDNGSLATNLTVTATKSAHTPGAFDIYVWKPTAANDTTPIAATVPVTVRWHAWGTQ